MASTEASGFSKTALALFILLLLPLHAMFLFLSPVGETKYMIGLLIQNWFCQ